MRRGGIRWARIDLTWDVIEPEPGKYRWDVVDRVVADAEANGVNLLGILGYCPTWAASGPSPFFPPWDVAHWKEFVRTIVGRYKGRIRHWTLWNEPNSESFFRGTLDQYINVVLLPGAKAAKEADPDCRIVGPDLAHLSGADWDKWLDKILARAGGAFDVIGHHCYKGKPDDVLRELDGRKKPWEAPSVRQILEKRGAAGKPFWLTETGWRSTQVGEQKQAGYIVALLRGIAARSWIDKVFLFELRDSPSLPGYGLLRTDGTPKPAFEAYKGFIEAAE